MCIITWATPCDGVPICWSAAQEVAQDMTDAASPGFEVIDYHVLTMQGRLSRSRAAAWI
jgi:hypothetical protein